MIHWGVIGYGRIAKRFIESLSFSEVGKLYAIASHSKQKQLHHLDEDIKIYDDYEKLINDEHIDAVYIALPHAYHYQWAKKALLNNKVVLCEKPATLSYEQTKELCDISKQKHTLFVEGIKTRFIPMILEIKSLIDKGTIGDIQRIETAFCGNVDYDENSYLYDVKQGGALYDLAIYNIATILDFIHSPVKDIQVKTKYEHHIDVHDEVELLFENGQSAYIEVSMCSQPKRNMKIIGTLATIEADPFYRPTQATVHFTNGESFTGEMPYQYDDFYTEIEEVHRCIAYIETESPRMTHQDSLDCIRLIERIKEASHG